MKTRGSVTLIAILVAACCSPLLAQVGQTWDQQFPGPNRFKVLSVFGNAAVFDKETGLVWERSPSTSIFGASEAHVHCNTLVIGNRFGWRVPTIQELSSLIDTTQANPALSLGHPFINISTSQLYWSANADTFGAGGPWSVGFNGNGQVTSGGGGNPLVWCVRGAQGVDVQ